MTLSPSSKLGPYEIDELLGVGGMGEVYRARERPGRRRITSKSRNVLRRCLRLNAFGPLSRVATAGRTILRSKLEFASGTLSETVQHACAFVLRGPSLRVLTAFCDDADRGCREIKAIPGQ